MWLFRSNSSKYETNEYKYSLLLKEMKYYYLNINKITDCKEYWFEKDEKVQKDIQLCTYYEYNVSNLSDIQKSLIEKVHDKIIKSMDDLNNNMYNEYCVLKKEFKSIRLMSNDDYKRLFAKKYVFRDNSGEYMILPQSVTINLLSLFDLESVYSNDAYKKLYFKESGLTLEPTIINKECLSAIYLSAIKKGYLTTLNLFYRFSMTPCPPFDDTVYIPGYFLNIINNIANYYNNHAINNIDTIFYYVYEYQAKKLNVKYDKKMIDKINEYFVKTATLKKLVNKNYKYVSLLKEVEKYNKIKN